MVAIGISPAKAAAAGCAASSVLVEDWSGDGYWLKNYRATASGRAGWAFDHWEQVYSYTDVDVSGKSGTFDDTSTSNPWHASPWSETGVGEWVDSSWTETPGYRVGSRTVVSMTAVFRRVIGGTGRIVRGRSGRILFGSNGGILYDGDLDG